MRGGDPAPAGGWGGAEVVGPRPRWGKPVFLVLGVGLLRGTVLLALTLPSRHGTHFYNVAWTGFDVALAGLLIATAVGAARRALWLQGVAAAAAAMVSGACSLEPRMVFGLVFSGVPSARCAPRLAAVSRIEQRSCRWAICMNELLTEPLRADLTVM